MLGVVQFAAQYTKEIKSGQVLVQFDLCFFTGQIAKKTRLSGQKPDTWQP